MRSDSLIDFCSTKAATTAARRWHYSGKIPVSKQLKFGVWEDGSFIGAILFGTGASPALHRQFGVGKFEVCELTRVALTDHKTPVSRLISIACKKLKQINPGIRVVVSFADPTQGHHGGIYQAAGWTYTGRSADTKGWKINGKVYHNRTLSGGNFGGWRPDPKYMRDAEKIISPGKHRYAMAFSRADRDALEQLAQPYPKRAKPSNEAAAFQAEEGGAIPTCALHIEASVNAA